MLIASAAFLFMGADRVRRGQRRLGEGNTGMYILIGFALFAMGDIIFLLGIFHPMP